MAQYIVPGAIVPEMLRGDNYEEWSSCVKNFLLSQDLWDVVEANTEPPKQESHNEVEFKAWRKRNATALHAFQITCAPYILSQIKSTDSAQIAWNILATSYGHRPELPQEAEEANNVATTSIPEKDNGSNMATNFETDNARNIATNSASKEDNAGSVPSNSIPQEDNAGSVPSNSIPQEENAGSVPSNSIPQEDNAGIVNKETEVDYSAILRYAHNGDWRSMEMFLEDHPRAIDAKIGFEGYTALQVAIKAENVEIVKKLVELMPAEALSIKENGGGLTALHYAACGGITQMAIYLIEKHPDLVRISDNWSFLPLTMACAFNRREMTVYLYSKTPSEVLTQQDGLYGSLFLETCIRSHMLDIALKALDDHPSLAAAKYGPARANALLWSLSITPTIFPSSGVQLGYGERWIYKCINIPAITGNVCVQGQSRWQYCMHGLIVRNFLKFSGIKKIYDLKTMHAYSSRLLDYLGKYLSTLDGKGRKEIGIEIACASAIKFGIVEIIIKAINEHPQLLEYSVYVTDVNRDLIKWSVINRHEKVFNLLYGLSQYYRGPKTRVPDGFGNTLLHLAGMLSPPSVLARIPGAALQMQRELQWYKEIESNVNPAYKSVENIYGKTPAQVFSEFHKELVKEGEKWMKGTATSYTVVGALIITIMFTAAFTVPGGNIQDIGIPVFLHNKAFQTFIISDAISLFASSTSVSMFLGILTSRYAEEDFLESLPKKLIIGLSTLFISIAAMMVSFCAALVITLNGKLEIIVPIVLLACIPVTLFMFLQFPLLVEIFMSTYGPGIFDRKMKRWY